MHVGELVLHKILARCKVRQHSADRHVFCGRNLVEKAREPFYSHSETAQPGVDLEMKLDALALRRVSESSQILRVVDHGSDRPRENVGMRVAIDASEDQDGGIDPRVSKLDRFLDQRDAEPLRAGGYQSFGNASRAVPIRVRLHDGPYFGVACDLSKCAEIVNESRRGRPPQGLVEPESCARRSFRRQACNGNVRLVFRPTFASDKTRDEVSARPGDDEKRRCVFEPDRCCVLHGRYCVKSLPS